LDSNDNDKHAATEIMKAKQTRNEGRRHLATQLNCEFMEVYLLDRISCPTSSRHRNYARAWLYPAADPLKPAIKRKTRLINVSNRHNI